MKTEENKKQEELNDEQLDNVAGGGTSVNNKYSPLSNQHRYGPNNH